MSHLNYIIKWLRISHVSHPKVTQLWRNTREKEFMALIKQELEISHELENIIASNERKNELSIYSMLRSNPNSDKA